MEWNKRFWMNEEVSEMLDIMRKSNISQQLDGKTRKNHIIYKTISQQMKWKNYIKTSEQIRTKLRTLKKKFYEVQSNGAKVETCPHYYELNKLFGTRREGSSEDYKDSVTDIKLEWSNVGNKASCRQNIRESAVESYSSGKRSTWKDEEISEMLDIIRVKNIWHQLQGKTRRNNVIYKAIAEQMKSKNYIKTSDQIRTKLRNMKKQYNEVKRNNAISGSELETCPYYYELNELSSKSPVLDDFDIVFSEAKTDFCNIDSETTSTDDDDEDTQSCLSMSRLCQTLKDVSDTGSLNETSNTGNIYETDNISIQQILTTIAKDLRHGMDRLTKQNEAFLKEQRNINAEFMNNMRQLLSEDRAVMMRFMKELMHKRLK